MTNRGDDAIERAIDRVATPKVKAYNLSIKDNEDAGPEIVFAHTAKAAKKLIGDLADSLEQYIDLRVVRDKRYDGMENLSPAQLALHQWRGGWRWFDTYDMPDPDKATDAEFYEWYEKAYEVQS